jgi:hypothetical protein
VSDHRLKRTVAVSLSTLKAYMEVAVYGQLRAQQPGNPSFSDSGLAGDDNCLTVAGRRQLPAIK